MHDFWKSWLWWFFFLNDVDFFYSLKMNKAWANAPSLEHEFMSLEKNLIWLIFENNYASDDFLKTSELDTLECLSLIKKRKSFWMLINLKKKNSESMKLHGIAWMYDGGAMCHLVREECHSALLECRSALLECQMALGHATTLMPW